MKNNLIMKKIVGLVYLLSIDRKIDWILRQMIKY